MSMRVALHTRLQIGNEVNHEQAHQQVPAELVTTIRNAGLPILWDLTPELIR